METTKKIYAPHELICAEPIHPGEMLKDELQARGISQRKFAGIIGMPYTAFNEIINGHRPITTDTALKIEAATGITANLWIGLQYADRPPRHRTVGGAGSDTQSGCGTVKVGRKPDRITVAVNLSKWRRENSNGDASALHIFLSGVARLHPYIGDATCNPRYIDRKLWNYNLSKARYTKYEASG